MFLRGDHWGVRAEEVQGDDADAEEEGGGAGGHEEDAGAGFASDQPEGAEQKAEGEEDLTTRHAPGHATRQSATWNRCGPEGEGQGNLNQGEECAVGVGKREEETALGTVRTEVPGDLEAVENFKSDTQG